MPHAPHKRCSHDHTHPASAVPEKTGVTADYVQIQVERCVGALRELGLRRTRALELVVEGLARMDMPVRLADLAASADLQRQCDPATVYRLVNKLEEHGLVRRLGLNMRSAYYTLIVPERHHDYLVCTCCGKIQEIEMACPVHELEKILMVKSGYVNLYHELEFFGTCPTCAR